LSWNRNTTSNYINSLLRITDTLNNIVDCNVLGPMSILTINLPLGVYKWQVINGTDLWDGGYAEVASPAYYLYVGLSGLSEADENSTAYLFPNPAADYVNLLNLEPGVNEIEIYDVPGQKVFSANAQGGKGHIYSVSLTGFNKGVYLVSITNNEHRKISKLLVH